MLAALNTVTPRQLRCAIVFRESLPEWSKGFVEELSKVCGSTNLVMLSLLQSTSSQSVEALRLDFILNLDAEVPLEWASFLPYGIWSLRFGPRNLATKDASRFGIGELWNRATQEVALVCHSLDGKLEILKRGKFRSVLHSLRQHRVSVLAQCSDWPARLAQQIIDTGKIKIERSVSGEGQIGESLLMKAMLFALLPLRKIAHVARAIRRAFIFPQWNIGMATDTLEGLLEAGRPSGVDWLMDLKWPLFYADPFITSEKGEKFVFAERYDFCKQKGAIAVLPLDGGIYDHKRDVALEFPFHTSYPCLIRDNERLFCVPETLARREIAIYRCEKFPRVWQKVGVVAEGDRYADPTIFRSGGLWWVFATIFDDYSEGNSRLHAWYSSRMSGPWIPHLLNPIKCDASSSRSAGNVFNYQGHLLRPAQDCSTSYGQSIVLQRINRLTPEAFSEEFYRRISPSSEYPDACHHLSMLEGTIFIDGRRDFLSLSAGIFRFRREILKWSSGWAGRPETKMRSLPVRLETAFVSRPTL